MIYDTTLGAKVLQAPISFSSPGDHTIIPGVNGLQVKVLQFFYVVSAAVVITFKSNATPISGPLTYTGNGAQVQDYIQLPLTCNVGDSFVMNSDTAAVVGGTIWYIINE